MAGIFCKLPFLEENNNIHYIILNGGGPSRTQLQFPEILLYLKMANLYKVYPAISQNHQGLIHKF